MPKFFIDRPIFAWVIAIFIIVMGLVSYKQIPVAQYPQVAPPSVEVSVGYPGASAEVLNETVISVIEREMNGSPGLAYMSASSEANGRATLTLSFEPGTDIDMAQVDVQNRLSRATPRLPTAVTQQGVKVEKSSASFLLFITMTSSRADYPVAELSDYVSRNVLPEIQRVKGVGMAQLFAAERAMRIWIDPAKLAGFDLSTDAINAAIAAQNLQVSSGTLGDVPSVNNQPIFATILVDGQLKTPEQFGEIVLRANTDGSTVRLRDVATIELGSESYAFSSRFNGDPAAAIGVQLSPTGNAVETSNLVHERLQELQKYFPPGVEWAIPYDTAGFVKISMEHVFQTLAEAIGLVFLVMFLFLQNWRYTIIPTIVVPIALLGTVAVLNAMGFSLNVLSMFGMVLVIGIVVDDAIIVVENVERIMSEEGLSPLQASRKAMGQISGAIVGVTVVLIAVFIPLAFFSGSIGNIYRQFSVTMVVSIAFSAFLALTLTPALCATLLKPVQAGHHHEKKGFFGWFNRSFDKVAKSYQNSVGYVLGRNGRTMMVYAAITAVAVWVYVKLPAAFLPNEDQGYMIVLVQTPSGATQQRTREVIEQAEGYFRSMPEVRDVVSVLGFTPYGQGQNNALMFVPLKDWSERTKPEQSAAALSDKARKHLAQIRDGFLYPVSPPPIPELGTANGFEFRLQDRGSVGHEALLAARNQLLGAAGASPVLTGIRPEGVEDAPQLRLNVDRDKAQALGVPFSSISSTLSTALGSAYINDFPNSGRLQRVMVQADAKSRMQPKDLLALNAVNHSGANVPFSSFATTEWVTGPMQVGRYNGYPSMSITGSAAPGISTGQAMQEMETLAAQLPDGIGFEWTGQSREEKLAGNAAMILYAFSILAVFLCLAALYESWTVPMAVILVVPLGFLGVVVGTWLRSLLHPGDYANDVYFQIGLVTIIGLSAKNAILIVEFAKDLQEAGKGLLEATLEAAHLRFRPILMTSLAFTFGVLPLFFASGASSASQRAIGTGVVGGMITGTVLALVFVPTFFLIIRSIFKYKKRPDDDDSAPAAITQKEDSHA